MRSLSLSAVLFGLVATLGAQSAPVAATTIDDLHLVEYGAAIHVRDVLIEDGGFYGDLGQAGVARLTAGRLATLAKHGVPVAAIPEVLPGEVIVAIARDPAGAAPIYGRVLLARPTFFLTAAVPSALPDDCGGSGFHGGVQIVPLDRPYVPVPARTFGTMVDIPDPVIVAMVGQVQQSNLLAHVTALSAIYTRRTTQPENAQAIQYVTNQLSALPNITWRTETFNSSYGPNIIAELAGNDLAHEIVMVGAHIDSIVGGSVTGRSPGADDNASGSALVLELARLYSGQQFRRTIRFGWWNAEELGLIGSAAYAAAAAGRGDQIVAYVNADMNAYRATGDTLSIDFISNDSTPSLINHLIQATQTYVPGFATNVGSLSGGTSDHRSFFRNGFAAAFPFEDIGQYSPYIHSSNDVIGTSANDFQLSTMITQATLAGVAELAEIAVANPGVFSEFGQGCAGTGTIPATCGSINANGGTLAGDTRTYEYAYRVANTGAAQITAFEIFTRSTTGGNVTVGAYLYADSGGLPSASPLASTTITVGSSPGFYLATLPAPVNVNGTFWVAMDHSARTTVLSNLTSGTIGSGAYRNPPTGSWNGSSLIRYPSFKVNCGGGQANATPEIGNDGVALINRSFVVTVDYAAPSAPIALLFGFSDQVWQGGTLPFPIPAAPGCNLLVSSEAADQSISDGNGHGSHTFVLPNDTNLIGFDVYHQWVVVDPGANPLGVAFSEGGKSTIGG